MKKSRIILTAVIAVCAVLYPFVCSTALSASYYTVKSPDVTEDMKIAFISDLHNSRYGRDMHEIVDMVDAFAPDIVIFGGDFFDDYSKTDNSMTLARRLTEKYPCFYSVGNHEQRRSDRKELKRLMSDLGVHVLNGESFDIGGNIRIIGTESAGQAEYAKEAAESGKCNILVYHYPEDFGLYKDSNIRLILCGHAHGGQIRIPFIEQGIYSPGQGFLPKYTSGLYTGNGTDMIVSRGLCRELPFAVIPRVFNHPEVVFVTMEKERQ